MIEVLGWITLALGGAYVLGGLVVLLVTGMGLGGLDTIPPALFLGAVTVALWITLVVWWSPLTIGVK